MKIPFASAVLASASVLLPAAAQAQTEFFLIDDVPIGRDLIDTREGEDMPPIWFTNLTDENGNITETISRIELQQRGGEGATNFFNGGSVFNTRGFNIRSEDRGPTSLTPSRFLGRLNVSNENSEGRVTTFDLLARVQNLRFITTISADLQLEAREPLGNEFNIGEANISGAQGLDLLEGGRIITSTRSSDSSNAIDINVLELTGSGDFAFGATGQTGESAGQWGLSVATDNGFTGNVIVADGTFTFDQALTLETANFILGDLTTATAVLNEDSAFASIAVGETILSDGGTFSAAELNGIFGGNRFSGAGSITVVPIPEPSTLALLGAGFALLARRQRRSAD